MNIIRGLNAATPKLGKSVLLIGNFDGVHRGHQQLLAQGAMFAADRKVPLVVLTFDPHPLALLRPDRAPGKVMRLSDRLDVLAQHDVDVTVVAESSPELLGMEAEAFIELVVETFQPTHIVEGSTFGFGKGRRGTADMLRTLGERFGYEACIIDPVRMQIGDREILPVSSSVVRGLLAEGKVHRATLCLGRPFTLWGKVVSGAGRGTGIGFPTANVGEIEQLIPGDGVYAGAVRVGDQKCLAGISIGTNPTFGGDGDRVVEAHLLDFEDDVYGRTIGIEFGAWIRSQRKFASADELTVQIASDIAAVRAQGEASESIPFRRRSSESGVWRLDDAGVDDDDGKAEGQG